MTRDFWCWRCVLRPVERPLQVCLSCRKADWVRQYRRYREKHKVTSEWTHWHHREPLEEADRDRTGKKPEHRPEY